MQKMSISATESASKDGVLSEVRQGSEEWRQRRLGKATASRIADIMRKSTKGQSASRQRYLGELVAERLTGIPTDTFSSHDMKWGSETEPEAVSAYAFYTSNKPVSIDFVDHPNIAMSGASPDRLIEEEGLLEVKCPTTHVHISSLLGAPIKPDYLTQIQWQMACTGRKWCDWASYDPRLPEDMRLLIRRVERDDARIAELEQAVLGFLFEVDETVAELNAKYGTLEAAE